MYIYACKIWQSEEVEKNGSWKFYARKHVVLKMIYVIYLDSVKTTLDSYIKGDTSVSTWAVYIYCRYVAS